MKFRLRLRKAVSAKPCPCQRFQRLPRSSSSEDTLTEKPYIEEQTQREVKPSPDSAPSVELHADWTDDEDENEDGAKGKGKEQVNRAPAPAPAPVSKDNEEAALNAWDPREVSAKLEPPVDEDGDLDLVHLLTGAPLRAALFCQFPVVGRTGTCWKGGRCRRPHRQEDNTGTKPDMKDDSAKKVEPRLYNWLPRQRRCAPGIVFKGKVVHASDPGEFYVVPLTEFKCMCKNYQNDQDKYSPHEFPEEFAQSRVGLRSYALMLEDMKEIINAKPAAATKYFPKSAVVAYRNGGGTAAYPCWERAVVTKPSSFDRNPFLALSFKQATVGITLLDTGEKLTTTSSRLSALPERFFDYAPFAYKCRLHGITSIVPGFWSTKTKSRFKAMVDQKVVLVESRRTIFAETEARDPKGVGMGRPYGVSLRVRVDVDGVAAAAEVKVPAAAAGVGVEDERKEDKNKKAETDGVAEPAAAAEYKYICVEQELCKTYEALAFDPRGPRARVMDSQYERKRMMDQQPKRIDLDPTKIKGDGEGMDCGRPDPVPVPTFPRSRGTRNSSLN